MECQHLVLSGAAATLLDPGREGQEGVTIATQHSDPAELLNDTEEGPAHNVYPQEN